MDQRVFRLTVTDGSPVVGEDVVVFEADLPGDVQLVGVQHPGETLPGAVQGRSPWGRTLHPSSPERIPPHG